MAASNTRFTQNSLGQSKTPIDSDHGIYRVGWEAFLRHVAAGAPLACDFTAGIRDVAFAEACHRSTEERRWIPFPPPAGVDAG